MTKLDTIFTQDYIRLSRPLVRKFGVDTALLLSEIYSEYRYWLEQKQIKPDGWFFSTIENMYNNTGLSKHQQLNACKALADYGIISIQYHGLPKKRYFKFNADMFSKLCSDLFVGSTEADKLNEFQAVGFDAGVNQQAHQDFRGFSF
jgi:hypothetical protein